MNYLKQYWNVFKEFLNKNANISAIDPIDDNESLGRYLLSRRHFSSQKNIVKPSAFMPPPNLHVSIFRIKGLDENAIWNIGENEVIKKTQPTKTLYGRAEIISLAVKLVGLEVAPDDSPPRHSNIKGWP